MITRTTTLKDPPTFSLKATVLSHGWHECAPMNWSEGGRCFQIIERQGDRPYRVSVVESRSARSGRKSSRLLVSVDTDRHAGSVISDDVMNGIAKRLRVTLGLDRDLEPFYAMCRRNPHLKVIPRIGAGRLIRSASMTENVVKTLCSTNVNWTQAVKMINRLGQLGPNLHDFRGFNAWPTPREILRAGQPYLKEVCRVGYRSDSILEFCERVCEGELDLVALEARASDPEVPSEEIASAFRDIRGIGPASANYLVGFLGRHDRLAVDSATYAFVAKFHTNGRKPTLKKIERIYAPFGPWKGLVCWLENWLTWDSAKGILAEYRSPRNA